MHIQDSNHDALYVLRTLIGKDFKVRYRNMSLGIFWSLVNPLVMMGVLTFVFTFIMRSDEENFPLFVLMGILPYNFFSLAWQTGTNSIVDNAGLIKKLPFPRVLIPIASVLANVLHYLIQLGLLLVAVAIVVGPSPLWLWLPLILAFQIVFVCGLSMLCSALDVYYRDIRYVVESTTLVMFWLVPIFYSFQKIEEMAQSAPFVRGVVAYNPMAAVILTIRRVLLYGEPPGWITLAKFAGVSVATLVIGYVYFRRVEHDFADYL